MDDFYARIIEPHIAILHAHKSARGSVSRVLSTALPYLLRDAQGGGAAISKSLTTPKISSYAIYIELWRMM